MGKIKNRKNSNEPVRSAESAKIMIEVKPSLTS